MRLRLYIRDSHFDYYLGILEKNVYCSDHELTTPLWKRDYWKSRILEIPTMADLKVGGVIAHCELPIESECQTLCSESTENCGPLELNGQQVSSLRVSPSSGIDKNPTSLWPEEFDTTPFHIIPGRNRRNLNTLNDYVQSIISRNLSDGNRKPGYVYVFQAENIQGYHKIGYTTLPVIERLRMLSFDCNRQMKVLFPTPPESAIMVPNALRVEELCHAELADCQVHIDCTGCLCEHKEWFQISAADAIAAVQKWSAWMNSNPYDPALGSLRKRQNASKVQFDEYGAEMKFRGC
jgi:hypothetical protein